jgi:hypothetical protein
MPQTCAYVDWTGWTFAGWAPKLRDCPVGSFEVKQVDPIPSRRHGRAGGLCVGAGFQPALGLADGNSGGRIGDPPLRNRCSARSAITLRPLR